MSEIDTNPKLQPQRDHLAFLDGVRGFASVYVMVFHAYMQVNYRHDGAGLSRPVALMSLVLSGGGYGVVAFIVLSGYCLMLPVARSADRKLRGGSTAYLFRRCRRILPPYYAALLLATAMLLFIPGMSVHPAFFANNATPMTGGSFLSHVFLVHNLNPDWSTTIDPAMWSVAAEFQIYFLFPFLFLPIYRRWGVIATVIVGAVISAGIMVLTHGYFDHTAPYFISMFCLGMLAASATVGYGNEAKWLERLPWQIITATALIAALALVVLNLQWAPRMGWIPHSFFGIATAGLLVVCGRGMSGGQTLRKVLESPAFILLGSFSYSLYLVHMPLEGALFLLLKQRVHSPDVLLLLNLTLCVPVIILAAYAFYWLVERPLMPPVTVHRG